MRQRSRRQPAGDEEPKRDPRPGQVTAVEAQRHDPDRVSVFVDGAFSFGLPAQAAQDEGVRVGEEIDDDRLAHLLALDERARALAAALAFLAYRPRSEREVRDRLRQKGYPPAAIDAAVEKLQGWRYLDDADFARRWVENRETHQPRGRRLLEQELRRKGIDREVARETVDGAEIDERAAALELARDRLRRLAGEDPATVRKRLADFLARRGFGWDVVRPTLDAVLGEASEEHGLESDEG